MISIKKKQILFLLALPVILYFLSTSFLKYSNEPFNADAVVLFIGKQNDARRSKARKLLEEGYANYLLIPARHMAFVVERATGDLKQIVLIEPPPTLHTNYGPKIGLLQKPEDTHRELLIAKAMMKQLGLKSAIFVSSPYHLRRIKMIAEAELGNEVKMAFVPAVPDGCSQKGCSSFKDDIRWLGTEMVKILWFLVYQHV